MALLAGNEKLKQNEGESNQEMQGGSQVGSGALVGGQSNIVGSGSGGQATAPGGQGAWTNIQAYLKANEGGTGSAKYFDQKVNETFDKERQDAQSQADATKNEAQAQVEKSKIGQDKASELISQAGQNYSYSGKQADPYQQSVNQLQTGINGDFTGPRDFNYSLSSQAQEYGNVGDNGAFKNIMEGLYNEAAGGQMNRGQLALQRQLDVSNQGLKSARDRALESYSGLNTDINNLATQTTQDLTGYEDQFRGNQESLRNYLSNQSNVEMQNQAQAEADARKAYDNTYRTGKSGKSTMFYGDDAVKGGFSLQDNLGPDNVANMSWQQAQQEVSAHAPDQGNVANWFREQWWDPYNADVNKSLDSFYGAQDSKYANTGDAEKRRYNTIMDILGNESRQDEGFKVRG